MPYKIIKKYPTQVIALLLLIILIFLFIGNFLLKKDRTNSSEKIYKLRDDGFCIFRNVLSSSEIDILKKQCKNGNYKQVQNYLLNHHRINNLALTATNKEYKFQDYIWIMQNSSVHTCHRDNNGSFFNKNQKYPSYTMLVYLEDMDKCLGVIPESQKSPNSYFINFSNSLTNLLCKSGDIILFNANLIHVGTITADENNLRIQLKLTHKDDIPYISYYEDYHKVLNKKSTIPIPIRKIQREISCTFPGFSDMMQNETVRTTRGSGNGISISPMQRIFSYLFYGDSDYYDVPNTF